MKADHAAQLKLVELQKLDLEISRAEHAKKALPELAALKELKVTRSKLGDEVIAADTKRADADAALDQAEKDLIPVRHRLMQDQERVDKGQGDAKTLQATISEIEHLKRRISNLEDAHLEAMEVAEIARLEHQKLKSEFDGLTAKGKELLEICKAKTVDLDSDIEQLRNRRQPIAEQIPAALLQRYQKIADRLGTGVGVLKNNTTSCCGLQANPSDLVTYQKAAKDEVLGCEECGRILVRP